MKQPPTPPEMECLGIKLADLQIEFKKGYVEVSCGYKKVRTPRDPEICDNFIKALSEGPKNAKSSMDNLFGGMSPQEFVKDFKNLKELKDQKSGEKEEIEIVESDNVAQGSEEPEV